ncbi:myosin [Thraustotheca clavata]|uniref:Myosin n=1 Tax=Thraustotheca clavata TaxID=74557 RepID=A0A1V9Z9I5_9STRA|nr:myosin [Thraustotheca clavata]
MGVEMVAGTKCYVPDEAFVWLPADVVDHDVKSMIIHAKVRLPTGPTELRKVNFRDKKTIALMSSKTTTAIESLPLQNDTPNVEDMITLNYLHEAAILYNVKCRFLAQMPYTYTGDICIAVNPYQWLPQLYTDQQHLRYLELPRTQLPPHVYATSIAAYKGMQQNGRNQSILVSGESGAGKTETTKILMNHIAAIAGGLNDSTIEKIIHVSPLLESFGNAKTLRNDNSSRFGKFTQLQFDAKGTLVGAKCNTYLLEKTRVVYHEDPERNYHIFYQLLASHAPELYLNPSVHYTYAGSIATSSIEGFSDAQHFEKTKTALARIGLNASEQTVLFQSLAAVLHLGQVTIKAKGDEMSTISQEAMPSLIILAKLLGVDTNAITRAICCRTVRTTTDTIQVYLKKVEAEGCRDALAKALYANIFDWLVTTINGSLENDSKMVYHIGVLDIFGFEHFKNNSFEQFCINYANEKLQQKFTQDVFKTVQLEYEDEGIQWAHINFADNSDVLQVIESKLGLISLLDDEVMRPRGNEESFVSKAATLHKDDVVQVIEFPKTSRHLFTIHHYAAPVTYNVVGFLEKHKDALLPDLADLMRSSSITFIRNLFTPSDVKPRRPNGRSLNMATVGMQFKLSLSDLMSNIQATNVQYIRCIKPNALKSATAFDHGMVVAQLRCAGVIEAIRIARAAYPIRHNHEEFLTTYRVLNMTKKNGTSRQQCEQLIATLNLEMPRHYQLGRTKIYFQNGVLEELDQKKRAILTVHALVIQRYVRGYLARVEYNRQRQAVIKLQSVVRCVIAMKRYHALYNGMLALQSRWRGAKARRVYAIMRRRHKALIVFSSICGFAKRRQFLRQKHAAIAMQSVIRMYLQKKYFSAKMQDHREQLNIKNQLLSLRQRLQVEQTKEEASPFMTTMNAPLDDPTFSLPTRNRSKSSAQLVMADAGGMIDRIHQDNARLRKENEEMKALFNAMRDEYEKLKQEKDMLLATHQLKIRQQDELVREKDKTISMLQKEVEKFRSGGGTHAQPPVPTAKPRGSTFRTLGSKKDFPRESSNRASTLQDLENATILSQKSATTSQFLQDSAQKLSTALDIDTTATRLALSNGLVSARTVSRASPAVSSLRDRLAGLRNKYHNIDMGEEYMPRPSITDSVYRGSMMHSMQLPPGWEMRMSRTKGRPYFLNETLRITLWDPPTEENINRALRKRDSAMRQSMISSSSTD